MKVDTRMMDLDEGYGSKEKIRCKRDRQETNEFSRKDKGYNRQAIRNAKFG